MEPSNASKEIDRIEREIGKDAKLGKASDIKPSRSQPHLDAVLVGAFLLAGIGGTFWIAEQLSPTQKTQLSAGAIGGAIGLLAGYGVGRTKS